MSILNRSYFQAHPFHLVSPSPFLYYSFLSTVMLLIANTGYIYGYGFYALFISGPFSILANLLLFHDVFFKGILTIGSLIAYFLSLMLPIALLLGVVSLIQAFSIFELLVIFSILGLGLSSLFYGPSSPLNNGVALISMWPFGAIYAGTKAPLLGKTIFGHKTIIAVLVEKKSHFGLELCRLAVECPVTGKVTIGLTKYSFMVDLAMNSPAVG